MGSRFRHFISLPTTSCTVMPLNGTLKASTALAMAAVIAVDWFWIALGAMAVQFAMIIYVFAQRRKRRQAERRSAEIQERLALIASMSGFGFWSWEAATDQVWASNHARSVLGVGATAPLVSGSLLAAIYPEDRSSVLDAIRSASAETDESMERELRVTGAAGDIRWITVKARSYRDPKGPADRAPIRRVTGYVIDDSQRKRTAAELLKLQQKLTHLSRVALLGELAGALAHELQQPLTAILCNAQAAQILVAKDPPQLDEFTEILQEITVEDKHAGQIIQRLRALLLRGETHFQRMEISELLHDVLSLARGTLKERNVQLNTRIDEAIPAVQGDRVELQQVLLNLIVNACESMSQNPPRDRRIEIVAALDADHGTVLTSVLDCGRGIDPERLERIFEPFFTTKEQGLGLGLSICQSIISAHGGRLWATNRSDRGTGVHFSLPILRTEAS
jgi:two-component system, LuxR family, sensor kinase FixL